MQGVIKVEALVFGIISVKNQAKQTLFESIVDHLLGRHFKKDFLLCRLEVAIKTQDLSSLQHQEASFGPVWNLKQHDRLGCVELLKNPGGGKPESLGRKDRGRAEKKKR